MNLAQTLLLVVAFSMLGACGMFGGKKKDCSSCSKKEVANTEEQPSGEIEFVEVKKESNEIEFVEVKK